MNAEPISREADLQSGLVVASRYRLLEKLGEGGFAAVWRALDEATSADVAIKFFLGEDRKAAYRLGMFQREAEALRRLDHPAIGRSYSSGRDGQRVFIVLELIPGDTMHRLMVDRFRYGRVMSFDEIGSWADTILDALQHAHAAGLVHRDLKPANIMMTGGQPPVRLLDFGVAKLLDDDEADSATTMGRIIGTPTYLSPEQIAHGKVDARSDLFAFGTLLFEMVTGKKLWLRDAADAPVDIWGIGDARKDFERNGPHAISHRILFGARPSLLDHRADAPPPLDALCRRLLDPAPDKRPSSAARVRVLLADALGGAPALSAGSVRAVSIIPTASVPPGADTTPVADAAHTERQRMVDLAEDDLPHAPPRPKQINGTVSFPASIGLGSSGSPLTAGDIPDASPALVDHLGSPEIGGLVLAAAGIGLIAASPLAGAGIAAAGAAAWAAARRTRRKAHRPTLDFFDDVYRYVGFQWRTREENGHATVLGGALVRPLGGGAGALELVMPRRELIPLRYRPTIDAPLARDPAVLFQRPESALDWAHVSNLILCDPVLHDEPEIEDLLGYLARRSIQASVVGAKLRIEFSIKRRERSEQVVEIWHACSAALLTARWLDRESARVRAWRDGQLHA